MNGADGTDLVVLNRAARRFWEAIVVATIIGVVVASVSIGLASDAGMRRVRDFSGAEAALVAHLTAIFAMLKTMGHRENMSLIKKQGT
jgi:hypothetical protein